MKGKYVIIGILIVIVGLQLVPVDKKNPAVISQPTWDSPETELLARRACFDCHSNETKWPWYSNIAPISWMIAHHVKEGREHFNISEYVQGKDDADESADEVESGRMPMSGYILLHSEAKLSDEEKEKLIKGLQLTFGYKKDEFKKPKFSH